MQNTPKTQDTWDNYSKKSGNSRFCMHNTDKSNTFLRGNFDQLGFSTNHDIFINFLQFYMWFYRGKTCNYFSCHAQNLIVALFYKINPVQITTIIAENTKNSLNLVPHTIEISIQICEKFSPIVKQNLAFFSRAMADCLHHYC